MKQLSVLIPTFNDACNVLVTTLHHQAEALHVPYEIIVADDGSTDSESIRLNRSISSLSNCRFIERQANVGRAAIRNFLVQQARYPFLLFIDADMVVPSNDYLRRYVEHPCQTVIDGGVIIRQGRASASSLRYQYEKSAEAAHNAQARQRQPYMHFHTANFLARRDIMLAHPFDERFRHYGYEDVLFGKQLCEAGIPIEHIDNPLSFEVFEDNAAFLDKTEEGLRTLHQFRSELKGYSALLTAVERLRPWGLLPLLRCWHFLFGPAERRRLQAGRYDTRLFQLYRLGFFLGL